MSRINVSQVDTSADSVIQELQKGSAILEVRGKAHLDNLSAAVLAATAARFGSSTTFELGNSVDDATQLSLPLFRMVAQAEKPEMRDRDRSIAQHFSSPGRLIASTQYADTTSAPGTGAWIAPGCLEAGIKIPRHLKGVVHAMAHEAISNAEEHGYIQEGPGSARSLRFFALVHHPGEPRRVSPSAAAFVTGYAASSGNPAGGWLEIVVVDSGMGMSYPGFSVTAAKQGRASRDLYEQAFEEEYALLQRTLARGVTTKGLWGRQLTSQSQPGAGSDEIAKLLRRARGYASLRTGRALAEWRHLEDGPYAKPRFEVAYQEHPVFYGTAWQLLLPMATQLGLFDGV